MHPIKGKIVLMGSGELTTSMVEVHKQILAGFGEKPKAAFLDTPAGFQLNADQISAKAVDYFRDRVGHPLSVASLKSAALADAYTAETAYHTLRSADYVLIGPGSPTYMVRQLKDTPVPEIFKQRIEAGACLAAASAAALTAGRFTLPVYEIYKVGAELHWTEGLDILGRFGLNLVVIPHWNNAEGGTHDTSCCFMGRSRFAELLNLLPQDVAVLGLDEHTACIIDFAGGDIEVRGVGRVRWRHRGREAVLKKGDRLSLESLSEGRLQTAPIETDDQNGSPREPAAADEEFSFWQRIHSLEADFQDAFDRHRPEELIRSLLALDRLVWDSRELESEDEVAQARGILRDRMVVLGTRLAAAPKDEKACLAPVVEKMLHLRQKFRENGQWAEADAIRDILERSHVTVEDTPEGARWVLTS